MNGIRGSAVAGAVALTIALSSPVSAQKLYGASSDPNNARGNAAAATVATVLSMLPPLAKTPGLHISSTAVSPIASMVGIAVGNTIAAIHATFRPNASLTEKNAVALVGTFAPTYYLLGGPAAWGAGMVAVANTAAVHVVDTLIPSKTPMAIAGKSLAVGTLSGVTGGVAAWLTGTAAGMGLIPVAACTALVGGGCYLISNITSAPDPSPPPSIYGGENIPWHPKDGTNTRRTFDGDGFTYTQTTINSDGTYTENTWTTKSIDDGAERTPLGTRTYPIPKPPSPSTETAGVPPGPIVTNTGPATLPAVPNSATGGGTPTSDSPTKAPCGPGFDKLPPDMQEFWRRECSEDSAKPPVDVPQAGPLPAPLPPVTPAPPQTGGWQPGPQRPPAALVPVRPPPSTTVQRPPTKTAAIQPVVPVPPPPSTPAPTDTSKNNWGCEIRGAPYVCRYGPNAKGRTSNAGNSTGYCLTPGEIEYTKKICDNGGGVFSAGPSSGSQTTSSTASTTPVVPLPPPHAADVPRPPTPHSLKPTTPLMSKVIPEGSVPYPPPVAPMMPPHRTPGTSGSYTPPTPPPMPSHQTPATSSANTPTVPTFTPPHQPPSLSGNQGTSQVTVRDPNTTWSHQNGPLQGPHVNVYGPNTGAPVHQNNPPGVPHVNVRDPNPPPHHHSDPPRRPHVNISPAPPRHVNIVTPHPSRPISVPHVFRPRHVFNPRPRGHTR